MKDHQNLHLKVQELCDCYSSTDPLVQMSKIEESGLEGALKWLALAALHGVNSNVKKISIIRAGDGGVSVTAEYRDSELPPPDGEVADHIFQAVRQITHIDQNKGKTLLALGIRDSSLDLKVSVKDKKDIQKVSIKFPE